MNKVACPYCEKLFDYNWDCEGFTQDSEQEFDCPHCEKTCLATVYWELCIMGERKKETQE